MMRTTRPERKTPDQLRAMRRAGVVVARTLAAVREEAAPGVSTEDLDRLAQDLIAQAGARSSFLNYGAGFGLPPYPAVTCISVNEEIVHGIPGQRILADGDLVSVDFGVSVDGWHGDSAITFGIGQLSPERAELTQVTHDALWAGIAAVRLGARIGDVSHAIERHIRSFEDRFGIVAEYTGHGIGSQMHQPPDVPNYGRPGRGPLITKGLCLAIEPMVTLGSPATATLDDQWTVVTRDSSVAAHWEHTVTATHRGVWVLTAEDGGEEMLRRLGVPFGPLGD